MEVFENPGDCHASVLCSALRAAFGGYALHAPAGAVARNDMVFDTLNGSRTGGLVFFLRQMVPVTTRVAMPGVTV